MPATLNEQVVDEVTSLNFKNLAELHSLTAGLSGQNQLSNQQRVTDAASAVHANALNAAQQMQALASQQALQISQNGAMLAQAMTGRVSRHILDLSAEQAVGFAKELSADLASKLSDISGQLASVQEMAKIAQTTPPETGQVGTNALLQQLASIQAVLQSLGEKIK